MLVTKQDAKKVAGLINRAGRIFAPVRPCGELPGGLIAQRSGDLVEGIAQVQPVPPARM